MHRLTLGYLSIADVPPLGVIRAASGAGFSAAGIRITGRKPQDAFGPDIVGNAGAIGQIRDCLAACAIRLSNISTYHLYPEIDMEDLLPVIETSARLGAEFIVAAAYDPVRARKPEGIDLAREAKSMRLYPGEGQLRLTQFLRALPAGVEIEAEVPAREHSHLTGDERAAILYEKASAYLKSISRS